MNPLPCPYCKDKVFKTVDQSEDLPYWVSCPSCALEGPKCESKEEAIYEWNREVGN